MAVVYLGLGSNIDRERNLHAGLLALRDNFQVLAISTVYESEAVGFDGDNFYNMVVEIFTDNSIADLVAKLRLIEDMNGRVRDGKRFSARTLDIDILTYDDQQGTVAGVELPRGEILTNAFVLWPLAEIAGHKLHPIEGRSYAELWDEFDKNKQRLWPLKRI